MTTGSGSNAGKEEKQSSRYRWVAYGIAVAVLVAFGLFIYFLLGRTAVDEAEWGRFVYLFGGVEAIAFTAAGYIFGKEVHRTQAEKAENRAKDAEGAATDAKERADVAERRIVNTKAFSDVMAVKEELSEARGAAGGRGRRTKAAGMDRSELEAAPPPVSGVNLSKEDLAELYLLAKKLFLES